MADFQSNECYNSAIYVRTARARRRVKVVISALHLHVGDAVQRVITSNGYIAGKNLKNLGWSKTYFTAKIWRKKMIPMFWPYGRFMQIRSHMYRQSCH